MEDYWGARNRYLRNEEALKQSLSLLRDSARHTPIFDGGSTRVATPTAPPISQTAPTRAGSGTWRRKSVTQTATAHRTPADDTIDMIETSWIITDALKGLYTSGELSDLVISCRGRQYNVHRAVVCTQSDFFKTACRGSFKEAREGKIDLPDDNPRLVHIMVYCLYHFDYNVEILAYETDVDDPAEGPLYTHAQVYALAEKYLIPGLKAAALRQFKAAAARSFDLNDFLQATEEVYMSTIENDRGLRDIVLETICSHPSWLDKEEVREVLERLESLTYDVAIYPRTKRDLVSRHGGDYSAVDRFNYLFKYGK